MKLNHLGTIKLETERLILRRFDMSDAEQMFYNWANDPEVTKYLTWNHHKNIDDSRFIIGLWLNSYQSNEFYQWGIELKSTGELIGAISVVDRNENILMCEIGYCIGRKYWGNGYVLEALNEVMRFLFKHVGVNRIQAAHHIENTNSGKVMLKAGMKYEGMLREYTLDNKGNLVNADMYSILRSEYEKI